MIILGIDPGFGRMGFGCVAVERGAFRPIDYGVVTTPAGDEFHHRLSELETDLVSLIKTHKPGLIALEKLFFNNNARTAMRVAESRGVVLLVASRENIPVIEFTPGQIKKAVTGDGGADKRAMQQMVTLLLSLKQTPEPDDAADALAVAITAGAVQSL